jgi:hypothetical protein
MSETTLQRASVLFALAGIVALLVGVWPLALALFVAAAALYGRLATTREHAVAKATTALLDAASATPQAHAVDTAESQLARLLRDAGLMEAADG